MSSKGKRNLAIGALVAAGVGYAAGILTAPKSGKETRHEIQDAAVKAKTAAEKKLKTLHVELTDLIETGKHKAKDLKDVAKQDLVEALGGAQLAKDKIREILSALHEGDTDDRDLKKAVSEASKAIEHLKNYIGKPAKSK